MESSTVMRETLDAVHASVVVPSTVEAQLVHGEKLARSSFTLRLSSNIDGWHQGAYGPNLPGVFCACNGSPQLASWRVF